MLPFMFDLPAAPLRVLCIGAHCDDIEIGSGGTLLQLLAARPDTEVTWLVLTGSAERRDECERSAAAFLAGAARWTLRIEDLPERHLPWFGTDVKRIVAETRSQHEPHLVVCPDYRDLHQDHRVLGEVALQTFRDHPILHYEIVKYDGDLHTPNAYVALDDAVARRKVDLLMELFPSQHHRSWFDPELFLGHLRVRGVECNAEGRYAEGFHLRKFSLRL